MKRVVRRLEPRQQAIRRDEPVEYGAIVFSDRDAGVVHRYLRFLQLVRRLVHPVRERRGGEERGEEAGQ